MIEPRRLLILAETDSVANAIGAKLIADGLCIAADSEVDAVLIDGTDMAEETPFLDLGDDAFTAQVIGATVARVAALQDALSRVGPSASIVIVGSDVHLGRWHATGQAAASAALAGIMRSVAMEYGRQGVCANMIALPFGTSADDEAVIGDAATQAAALFDTRSITGETILIDAGGNLKFRQAKRR